MCIRRIEGLRQARFLRRVIYPPPPPISGSVGFAKPSGGELSFTLAIRLLLFLAAERFACRSKTIIKPHYCPKEKPN